MRYAVHRKDANQDAIVEGLEAVGVKVVVLGGKGIPDLLVGHGSRFLVFEIKDGEKPASQRKLRPGQQKFADKFAGYPVYKIESLQEAFSVLGIRTS